jgi:hypothetical protein
LLCPRPAGERATRKPNAEEGVRGLPAHRNSRNPLTPHSVFQQSSRPLPARTRVYPSSGLLKWPKSGRPDFGGERATSMHAVPADRRVSDAVRLVQSTKPSQQPPSCMVGIAVNLGEIGRPADIHPNATIDHKRMHLADDSGRIGRRHRVSFERGSSGVLGATLRLFGTLVWHAAEYIRENGAGPINKAKNFSAIS